MIVGFTCTFGKKSAVVIASILLMVGAILEADAHSFGVLLAAPMILGCALGLLSGTVSAYIADNCAVRWSGGFVSLYRCMELCFELCMDILLLPFWMALQVVCYSQPYCYLERLPCLRVLDGS